MPINKTHGSFDDILRAAGPRLRPLCQSLRKSILALHPDCIEVVWPRQKIASFGVGPKKMTDHYAYIGIQSSHVNLGFYHGAALQVKDPAQLLEGSGQRLRHIKIRTPADATSPAVAALLREAIADRQKHSPAAA